MANVDTINLDELTTPLKGNEKEITTIQTEKSVKPKPTKAKANAEKIHRSFVFPADFDEKLKLIQDYLTEKVTNGSIRYKKSDALTFLVEEAYKKAEKYFEE